MHLDPADMLLLVKTHFLLLAELFLVTGLLLLWIRIGSPVWLRAFGRRWRQLAARPVLSLLVPAVGVVLLRLLLLPLVEVPYPQLARDEFSYLLGADTFASGRLTNPPHPHFESFQSPHIIFRPTYASKYPPGQALVLGLGEWIGHPWAGVLLSVSALILAAGWAARGWLPPSYALLATTLLALRVGLLSYWANSYWGGAVAAVGGALLLGALARLKNPPKLAPGILLGVGLGIMALSRPLEGFIFSAAALLIWVFPLLVRRGGAGFRSLIPALACSAVVVSATLLWLAYYQYAVTGDALKTPYQVWNDAHQSDGVNFAGEPINAAYERFVEWSSKSSNEYSSFSNRAGRVGFLLLAFYWCPLLGVFVVSSAPWLAADRRVRLIVLAVFATLLTWLIVVKLGAFSHYIAPLTAGLLILGVQGIRIFVAGVRRRFPRHRVSPSLLLAGLPILLLGVNLLGLYLRSTDRLWTTPYYDTGWCCPPGSSERARVERFLNSQPGRHLIFVRNPAEGMAGTEWVYNEASIDDAKIVWAREVTAETDCALRDYYSDREVWVTYVDEAPARATPFPDPSCGTTGLETQVLSKSDPSGVP